MVRGLGHSAMVDVDLGGLLRGYSVEVYCWGYLLLGKLGVGSSILKIMLLLVLLLVVLLLLVLLLLVLLLLLLVLLLLMLLLMLL